jgi:hydrogenase maturation protease
MIERQRSLVVGIGSPHGDDQAGWLLIEKLSSLELPDVHLRKAAVPHNLLDWTGNCKALHVVDACHTEDDLHRIEVRDESCLAMVVQLSRDNSSHDLGIATVIDLGRTLGVLPAKVIVWAIPGAQFEPGQPVSAGCRQEIDHCANSIATEIDAP